VKGFEERLRELGWVDGRGMTIVYRWTEGDSSRYAAIADELVNMNVDVILTVRSAATRVMQATRTIPIVLAAAVDPVASGFIDSLAHPGRNVTGLCNRARSQVSDYKSCAKRYRDCHEWPFLRMLVTRGLPERWRQSRRPGEGSGSQLKAFQFLRRTTSRRQSHC
jgi:hypothetical protein